MADKKYFPMYVDLTDRQIVIIGGGTIAARRVRSLLPFRCRIRVIAPECTEDVKELAGQGSIEWKRKCAEDTDIEGADIVLTAASDAAVNDHIYELCKEKGICVNHAGNQNKCDFYFPALIFSEDMVIGLCSGGKDHGAVRRMRENVQGILEKSAGKE